LSASSKSQSSKSSKLRSTTFFCLVGGRSASDVKDFDTSTPSSLKAPDWEAENLSPLPDISTGVLRLLRIGLNLTSGSYDLAFIILFLPFMLIRLDYS
jgi:hypothetical protein